MKTIAIAGGTGFVGRHLAKKLVSLGHRVVVYSRSAKSGIGNLQYAVWDPALQTMDAAPLKDVDAVVNLAGAGVVDKRWSDSRKREIISSRVDATHFLIEQLRAHAPNCKTFIAASATGIYGPDKGGAPFKETDPAFDDFLAQVCRDWEAATLTAKAFYRTVIFRFGIVLGKDGGAYVQFAGPMKLGVMPILGSGRQVVSWVHVSDISGMIVAAIEGDAYSGIYNAVAPAPVPHKELMKAIAKAKGGLKIPVPVPPFVLRIMLGESSIEVLKSCTVSAQKAQDAGYVFRYPTIEEAAKALERKR